MAYTGKEESSWSISLSRQGVRLLRRAQPSIRERFAAWAEIVETSGPAALREIRGLRDEALRGKWNGYRSSRLSDGYRVVYRVANQELTVYVERISNHDYSR